MSCASAPPVGVDLYVGLAAFVVVGVAGMVRVSSGWGGRVDEYQRWEDMPYSMATGAWLLPGMFPMTVGWLLALGGVVVADFIDIVGCGAGRWLALGLFAGCVLAFVVALQQCIAPSPRRNLPDWWWRLRRSR